MVGIGNALVDVLAQVEDSFITDHRFTKGAMALVDEQRSQELYGDMGPSFRLMRSWSGYVGNRST